MDDCLEKTAGGAGEEIRDLISVLVPVYNEEQVLPEFHRRLGTVLDGLPFESEVLYVNDGSSDETIACLRRLRASDARIAVVDLSRNFGKELALTAGLDYVRGDAVVIIDADLQDPPELIPKLVSGWTQGYDVVYAKRTSREGETLLKRFTSYGFYRVIQRMTRVRIPEDTGDFRLLSGRAVESLRRIHERNRFMKGLFAWIGYPQLAVPYERHPRFAGTTKWNYWRLWNFAIEGITSFSTTPLRVATYFGLLVAIASLIYALVIIYKTLAFGEPVRGYPSLMVVVLFLGGIQLIGLGILGEYLGRTYEESKARPLYIVQEYHPARSAPGNIPVPERRLEKGSVTSDERMAAAPKQRRETS